MTRTISKPESATCTYHFRTSSSNSLWWNVLFILTLAAMATRLYGVDQPASICWDEVHFVKFAAQYINRTDFFDTHPPLGKMMLGFVGYLSGFDMKMDKIISQSEYDDTSYVNMRIFCTTMGALLVPLSFLTVWEMTSSLPASTFSATLLLFDNGIITLTRFILPDPPMLFFISASFYCMVKFYNQQHRPFSASWWWWLCSVGVMMSGPIGIKFVGLFIFIIVGLRAVTDLWIIFGDISKPVSYTLKHFLARAVCLIALPTALYLVYFYVHLRVLNMSPYHLFNLMVHSSAYQSSFENSPLRNISTSHEAAFGSLVTIRSALMGGLFLSSSNKFYPAEFGMNQQVVYPIIERNLSMRWWITPFDVPIPNLNSIEQVRFIRHGDIIRLEHKMTGKYLRPQKTPGINSQHQRIIASEQTGEVDVHDIWQVVIDGAEKKDTILTVNQPFRLIHYIKRCALTQIRYNDDLSEWGNHKLGVTCYPHLRSPSAVWYLESSEHHLLPNVSYEQTYGLSFLQRFVESHLSMHQANARLMAKIDEFSSRPWMWPILYKGQHFSASKNLVYLLGNPVVWWGNCFFLVAYWMLFIVKAVRDKRQVVSSLRQTVLQNGTLNPCLWLYLGWMAHYLPFWPMTRVLFFHHYFPALLFSTMISGIMLNYFIESILPLPEQTSNISYNFTVSLILTTLCYSFYLFAPLVYGMPNVRSSFPNSTMYGRNWISSWEF